MKTNYHRQYNHRRHFSRFIFIAFLSSLFIGTLSFMGVFTSFIQNGTLTLMSIAQKTDTMVTQLINILTPQSTLLRENQLLRSELQKISIAEMHMQGIQQENNELRKLLNASVALQERIALEEKPSHTLPIIQYQNIPYGTLLAQKTTDQPVKKGDLAHFGTWAIGTVVKITNNAVLSLSAKLNEIFPSFLRYALNRLIGVNVVAVPLAFP